MKHLMMALTMLMVAAGLEAQVVESGVISGRTHDYFIPAAYAFDGKAYIVTVDEREVRVYDDNFNIIKTFNTISEDCGGAYYFNYDTGTSYGDLHVFVTQTLFNDDENYEYLVSERNDNDYGIISYKIVSDDGRVLQTITPGDGLMSIDGCTFMVINGKNFLKITMSDGDGQYDYFYTKDSNSNGIKQVGAPIKTRVHPSVVGRNENLTVELSGNDCSKSVVTVHDASGRNVYRATVPSGQKMLQINSASLNKGLNVVFVTDGKRNGNGSKVVVK